ncbi:unnamed protein product, partial [Symbiodinium sp. KB8]
MAMHVLVCILAEASPFWPSTSSCCGAMVTISHKILIQYKDEKAITVPSDMVMKHGEDDYMRLRPTNYAVIQLICGSSSCNASISSSGKLHELIRMRNEQLMENHEHEVEAIMASAMPLNTKTDHILHVLTGAGLAHRQKLKPRSCLIHPENRAQSMLSFHDVWMKGASMSMVGFNAKLVEGNTIAFAMSTEPSRRAMQIEKNKALIEQSSGHLAPINGQE